MGGSKLLEICCFLQRHSDIEFKTYGLYGLGLCGLGTVHFEPSTMVTVAFI